MHIGSYFHMALLLCTLIQSPSYHEVGTNFRYQVYSWNGRTVFISLTANSQECNRRCKHYFILQALWLTSSSSTKNWLIYQQLIICTLWRLHTPIIFIKDKIITKIEIMKINIPNMIELSKYMSSHWKTWVFVTFPVNVWCL